MAQHMWTVVCRESFIDKDTNNIALSVMEGLALSLLDDTAKEKRGLLPVNWGFVSLWCRDKPEQPEQTSSSVRILAPDGEVIAQGTQEIDLREASRLRQRSSFQQFAFAGPGWYRIEVRGHDGAVVANVPIEVSFVPRNS